MDEKFEKFTWTINNFSKLDFEDEWFVDGGCTWTLLVLVDDDNLQIFLRVTDFCLEFIQGQSVNVNFELFLVNQKTRINTLMAIGEGEIQLKEDDDDDDDYKLHIFGWKMSFNRISDFILDDNLIIVVQYSIDMELPHHHQNLLEHGACNITTIVDSLIKSCFHDYEDFENSTIKEKGFVLLVEEACHKHQSLIEYYENKNHSSMFTKWGFMALGRVLHFLKTKKVKDMNEEACKELEVLWKEVEAFGFDDLAWLEPHVKSALSMVNYKEKAMHVKKMKENVAALEVGLKVAREELVKAQEDFEERDLDDVLGY